jgi:peptidyl-prolyl cis-trans isomerase A (cyclophilin A)
MLGRNSIWGSRVMKQGLRALAALGALLSAHTLQATEVAVCTDRGRAVFELADDAAPLHVANFLRYVDLGYYSGTVFHRVMPEFVAQGGGLDRQLRLRPTLPSVANESSNGLHNTRGAVAAARTEDPDSASSQFFVNLADNTSLDGGGRESGYTVFARVKEGLEVFDAIGRLPTGAAGPFRADVPTPLVAIRSIARLDASALAAWPAEGREAALQTAIAAAAESASNAAEAERAAAADEALGLIGQYRALCGTPEPDIALTEARMALAADQRQRALFALDELLSTTDAAQPAYEVATALRAEATAEPSLVPRVVAGCAPPDVPALPDAAVATEDDMVAAQRQVRSFVAAGETHLACLAKVIDDETRPADERNAAVGEHNRTVAAMEEIAAAFNERIRSFKARD